MELADTSLTRGEIYARLEQFRSVGSKMTIKFSSRSQALLVELQRLVTISSTTHGWTLAEGPLLGILSQLTVNSIYRLYLYSSIVRRVVDSRSRTLWRNLIERDYGLIPTFRIDLKVYYLRRIGMAIGGRLANWAEESLSAVGGIVNIVGPYCIYASRKVFKGTTFLLSLPVGAHVIDAHYTSILTNLGTIYNLDTLAMTVGIERPVQLGWIPPGGGLTRNGRNIPTLRATAKPLIQASSILQLTVDGQLVVQRTFPPSIIEGVAYAVDQVGYVTTENTFHLYEVGKERFGTKPVVTDEIYQIYGSYYINSKLEVRSNADPQKEEFEEILWDVLQVINGVVGIVRVLG